MWPTSKLLAHATAIIGWLLLIPAAATLIWAIILKLYPVVPQVLPVSQHTAISRWPTDLNKHWQQSVHSAAVVNRVAISRLTMQIQGLWLADNAQSSVALLKYRNKNQTLSVGDELEPGVELVEIRKDKLVFKRQGQFEQVPVRLFNSPPASGHNLLNTAPSRPAALADHTIRKIPPAQQAPQKLLVSTQALVDVFGPDFRASLIQDPLQLLQHITLTPQTQGDQLQGFLLQPAAEAALFNAFNFENNDLLVAVDGISVADTPALLQLHGRLQTANNLDFDLIRNNERIQVRLEME